jgi:hypothetical protein
MRPLLLQHRTVSFRLLAKCVKCLFARSPPTLYRSVHENVSDSLLHSLFLCKTTQLSPFDLQSIARCRPFYKLVCWLSAMVNSDWLWHLLHFPWNPAFTRTFATSILWCYNFNGMIKWYDISCATLCLTIKAHYLVLKHQNFCELRQVTKCKSYAVCQFLQLTCSCQVVIRKFAELNRLLQYGDSSNLPHTHTYADLQLFSSLPLASCWNYSVTN